MKPIIKTLSVRVRDKHVKQLRQWAFEVNQVWNAANAESAEFSWVGIPEVGFINCQTSEFDLNKSLVGIRTERNMTIGAATCSNGASLARQDCYKNLELKLGKAQRAKNKQRVKAIHAKIKNTRKDAIHKFTHKIVKENSLIIVGNVSSQKLAKTKMAKSVLDAGWFMLKTQLEYKSKSIATQGVFLEVNESYTPQTCSC